MTLSGLCNKLRENGVILNPNYDPKHSLFSCSLFKAILCIVWLAVELLGKASIPILGKQIQVKIEIWSESLYNDNTYCKENCSI